AARHRSAGCSSRRGAEGSPSRRSTCAIRVTRRATAAASSATAPGPSAMPRDRTGAVVTFDEAPPEGFINFGIGQPSADLLPLELVRTASERFFASAHSLELNYGPKQGDPRFLAALSGLLEREYGAPAPPDTLFLTAG